MAKVKVNKGTKITKSCVEDAMKSLNLFDEDEVKEYVIKVANKSREYEALGGQQSLEKAMKDVNQEQMNILLTNISIKANNSQKFAKLDKKIKSGFSLKSLIIATTANKDFNIERSQRSAQQEMYRGVFSNLTKEQEEVLVSGKRDNEIYAAMDGKRSHDSEINGISDPVKAYPEEVRNPEIIKSNALPPEFINPDRMLRNFHNPSLIASAGQSLVTRAFSKLKVNIDDAKNIWREFIKERLDLNKTFGNTDAANLDGTLNMKKVDEIINDSFDNIIHERSVIFTKSVVANDREALAKKKRMFYHFKDWQAWGEYNKKFGKGTLHEALLADIHSSGNQIGIARMFGDSPDTIFTDLKKSQESVRQPGKNEYWQTDALFKQVRGIDKTSWSTNMANIGGALRTLTSMARLGSLALNSLSDISQVGGIAQRFGYGFWKPYTDAIIHSFNMLPSDDMKKLARILKINVDTHIGYMGRFADANHFGDALSKANNSFWWTRVTQAWDKGLKLSASASIARGLGRDSSKGWEALGDQTKSQLQKFGIRETEWDALRAKTEGKFFTTDNVDNLSNDEVKAVWNQSDKLVPLSEYRNHLFRKVYGMFDTICENAVLDPRTYERMLSTWNLPPGTWGGEIVRSVMQFKSYPIATMRRVWYGGMKDMDSTQGKMMYALSMSSGTFALGYLSTVLGSLAMGLTPPSLEDMSVSQKTKFLASLLAPGLGTFQRILDPNNENPHMLTDLALSPSVRLFSDTMVGSVAAATGHGKQAAASAKDFATYANPIGTVPFAEPFFDSLMGKKPYMQPGQKKLFGE